MKLRLDLYKDKEKQIKFLLHIALTFRLLPETLAELFQLSIDEVKNMLYKSEVAYEGLDYLVNHEFYDQTQAKEKFIMFYSTLIRAIKSGDKDKVKDMLNSLYDVRAIYLAKNKKKGDPLTEEDIKAILYYQVKYGISYKSLLDIFGINPNTFQTRFLPLLEEYPDLKWRYEHLTDFMFSKGGRK